MATATHADMQSGVVSLGGARLPADIQYKGLPGAPQFATLFGDPTKPGIFVQRVKFPAGIKVMPHFHPDEPRTVAVLSGTLYFGLGDSFDENKLQAFPAGTFFTEAPRASHYAWAKDGEVILQLTSVGPTANMPVKTVAKE
jgi:quercetin dioxygenase-like cupin family protein